METKLLPREVSSVEKGGAMNQEDEVPVKVIQMSEETLRNVIQESVQEFMVRIGIGWDDPSEMQKDFIHLREWRETVESIKRKSIGTLIFTLITGALGLIWLGIKASFGGH